MNKLSRVGIDLAKNDFQLHDTDRHGKAVCEAMSRPSMRFVAVKTVQQQDIQAAHRIRSELIGQRTGKANQIRGLTAEYGLVAPQQLTRLRAAIPAWLGLDHQQNHLDTEESTLSTLSLHYLSNRDYGISTA